MNECIDLDSNPNIIVKVITKHGGETFLILASLRTLYVASKNVSRIEIRYKETARSFVVLETNLKAILEEVIHKCLPEPDELLYLEGNCDDGEEHYLWKRYLYQLLYETEIWTRWHMG